MVASDYRVQGDVVALRYLTTDGRIEMCWPCRVVEDGQSLLVLFIADGTKYKAGPKRNAAEKLSMQRVALPPDEYIWRNDTLRLMFPAQRHSVWLFWEHGGLSRRFSSYFVNMEEPFRRTVVGFDTQDHTLDIDVAPDLSWKWRDTEQLADHVKCGFYTADLASDVWNEGRRVIEEIVRGTHPCLGGWDTWKPDPRWDVPQMPESWSSVPVVLWERHHSVYGRRGELVQGHRSP
jgi:hypothetical protein